MRAEQAGALAREMSVPRDRDHARELVGVLARIGGADWLALDEAARSWDLGEALLPGSSGELRSLVRADLTDPVDVLAVLLATMHPSGYARARAVTTIADLGSTPTILAGSGAPARAAALAVRLLDHVPQVRAAARAALTSLVDAEAAAAALDVALAGRARRHGSDALAHVLDAIAGDAPQDGTRSAARLVRGSSRPAVRRWVHQRSLDAGDSDAIERAVWDRDQWIAGTAARWLALHGTPAQLRPLLHADIVEARVAALGALPDADLPEEDLVERLTDRAPRVREQAGARARRRGLDVSNCYRAVLLDEDAGPRALAAGLDELARSGAASDVPTAVHLLDHPSPRVRASAATLVTAHTPPEEQPAFLVPQLLDPSSRVATNAANLLSRTHPGPEHAQEAWSSPRVSARRAARRLARGAGGWDRVVADLRASTDADRGLSDLGVASLHAWLDHGAATTWQPVSESQHAELVDLVARTPLQEGARRVLAFHAGIRPLPPTLAAPDLTSGVADASPTRTGRLERTTRPSWLLVVAGVLVVVAGGVWWAWDADPTRGKALLPAGVIVVATGVVLARRPGTFPPRALTVLAVLVALIAGYELLAAVATILSQRTPSPM